MTLEIKCGPNVRSGNPERGRDLGQLTSLFSMALSLFLRRKSAKLQGNAASERRPDARIFFPIGTFRKSVKYCRAPQTRQARQITKLDHSRHPQGSTHCRKYRN